MNSALLLLHGFLGAALVAHAMQKGLVFRVVGTAAVNGCATRVAVR